MSETKKTGSCLCGSVQFEITGTLRGVRCCHCKQCRKTSGHYVAATACNLDQLSLIRECGLRWYKSSESAKRGFCKNCGGNLFWLPSHREHISIMAGTLDTPTGLTVIDHICVADASDYYVICDGLPQADGL